MNEVINMIKGINLGAGDDWKLNGWLGLDILNGEYLNEKSVFQFKDNSIEYVFSSHFFEHINDETAINLLKESYRVLKPGGIVRITTPHFERLYNKCKENDVDFYIKNGILVNRYKHWGKTNIENNIYNTLVHFVCNYHDGELCEGNPNQLRCIIPILEKEQIISKLNELNVDEFCKWCLSFVPERPISKEKMEKIKQNKNIMIDFPDSGLEHINWWTLSKFTSILTSIGFRNIKEVECNNSSIPGTSFINEVNSIRGNGSIWIECKK